MAGKCERRRTTARQKRRRRIERSTRRIAERKSHKKITAQKTVRHRPCAHPSSLPVPVARRTGASIPPLAPSTPLPPFLLARVTRNWLCVTGGRQRLARSARPRPPPLPPPALAPPLQFRPLLALLAAHPPSSLLRGVRTPVSFSLFFSCEMADATAASGKAAASSGALDQTEKAFQKQVRRRLCGGVICAACARCGGGAPCRATCGRRAAPRVPPARHAPAPPCPSPPRAADGFSGLRQGGQAEGQVGRLARRGAAVDARGRPGH